MRKKLLYVILLLFFNSPSFANDFKTKKLTFSNTEKIIYDGNRIILKGFMGNGHVNIYSIIGNKIKSTELINLSSAIIPLNLREGNMYIIQVIYTTNNIKTFKIIAF